MLIQDKVKKLREANEILARRAKRKRTFIKHQGTLTVMDGQDMVDSGAVNAQLGREMDDDAPIMVGVVAKKRRCGRCQAEGHNARTCKKDAPEPGPSNAA